MLRGASGMLHPGALNTSTFILDTTSQMLCGDGDDSGDGNGDDGNGDDNNGDDNGRPVSS